MKVVIDITEDRYADIQRIASVQLDRRYPTTEQIIAKGVIINEPQKWIPVSERLPEDEQVVLVQDTNGTMWIWKYLGENLEYRGPYQWMDDNEVWQLIDEVVAWMPLPECYGGDSDS